MFRKKKNKKKEARPFSETLTVFNALDQILEVEPSLVLTERFQGWDFHHRAVKATENRVHSPPGCAETGTEGFVKSTQPQTQAHSTQGVLSCNQAREMLLKPQTPTMKFLITSATHSHIGWPPTNPSHIQLLAGLNLEFSTHPCFTSSNTATQKRR